MIGLRKLTKTNPLKNAVVNAPPTLVGGIFLYGRIGSGKSTGMKSLAEVFHDHGDRRYKILHLWGGDRSEQMYWLMPSQDHGYWRKVKNVLKLKQEGPKQYKVNILYPMSNHLRAKLPNNPPNIKSKVFTIPISSISVEDISLVIGNPANTAEYLWREAVDKMKKKENGAYLLKYFKSIKGEGNVMFKNFVYPLVNHKLLQSDYCNYNLDIVSEIRDREAITILCLDFIEKEFRLFILGWFLRQISVLIDNGRIPTRNIIMIQEAAEFFRATDDSIMPDKYKIFRRMLAHYIRMGRRGMHMFLDAQSPSETRGLVDGCLSESTSIKVVNRRGKARNRMISNCPEKFDIFSYNFKNQKIERKHAKKTYTGEKECYEIELEDGSKVVATSDHRFFNESGEVHVRDLHIDDNLAVVQKPFSHSILSKHNISNTLKTKYNNNEILHPSIEKVPWNKGKAFSAECRKRISDRTIQSMKDSEIIRKIKTANIGKHQTSESNLKRSNWSKKWHSKNKDTDIDISRRNKISTKVKEAFRNNPKLREISRANMIKLNQNPMIRKKALFNVRNTSPNHAEQRMNKILENTDYQFTGNGSFWVSENGNNFNPDFVDLVNMRIIEVFGDYWHKNTKDKDAKRLTAYKNRGFNVLVVTAKETKNSSLIKQKLEEFHNG